VWLQGGMSGSEGSMWLQGGLLDVYKRQVLV